MPTPGCPGSGRLTENPILKCQSILVPQKVFLPLESLVAAGIIVGREKLDVAKGVYNKLQAFEKFLEVYPEWRGKVVLIQVTTPALSESPKLERMCAELVSHINGTYGSLDFTPVHH